MHYTEIPDEVFRSGKYHDAWHYLWSLDQKEKKMKKNYLGVIYIETQWDNKEDFLRVQQDLLRTVQDDFNIIFVDGNKNQDLTVCLNEGIRHCIEQGMEYIHWAHPDFYYDDPNWYLTLRNTLQAYPEILKICASNSRDPIFPLRVGHEQSWLMRTEDFKKCPWLFFWEGFKKIGGCEDYYQHFQILANGFLVCITPEATVKHLGASTRGKVDTNEDQRHNQGVFGKLTGFGQLVEIHDIRYFGYYLKTISERYARQHEIAPALAKQLGFFRHPEWTEKSAKLRTAEELKEVLKS